MSEYEGHRHRRLPERDRHQHPHGLHAVHEHPCPGSEHDVGHQISQQQGGDSQPRAGQIVNPNGEGHRCENVAKRGKTEVSFLEQQVSRPWVRYVVAS